MISIILNTIVIIIANLIYAISGLFAKNNGDKVIAVFKAFLNVFIKMPWLLLKAALAFTAVCAVVTLPIWGTLALFGVGSFLGVLAYVMIVGLVLADIMTFAYLVIIGFVAASESMAK